MNKKLIRDDDDQEGPFLNGKFAGGGTEEGLYCPVMNARTSNQIVFPCIFVLSVLVFVLFGLISGVSQTKEYNSVSVLDNFLCPLLTLSHFILPSLWFSYSTIVRIISRHLSSPVKIQLFQTLLCLWPRAWVASMISLFRREEEHQFTWMHFQELSLWCFVPSTSA